MNSPDDINDAINKTYHQRGVKQILKSLLETPIGFHQIFVYPNNIDILREIYFHYIKRLLEDNNEIVIFFPYYETADSVTKVLSSSLFSSNVSNSNYIEVNQDNNNNNNNKKNITTTTIDVKRYINDGSLVIIDSDKAFSNEEEGKKTIEDKVDINKKNINNSNNNFASLVRMSSYHAKRLKKAGITILADYGFISEKKGYQDLIELEKSIPPFFDSIKIKQICLYNQNNFFNKFTKQQKTELLDLHSRSIMMMDN